MLLAGNAAFSRRSSRWILKANFQNCGAKWWYTFGVDNVLVLPYRGRVLGMPEGQCMEGSIPGRILGSLTRSNHKRG